MGQLSTATATVTVARSMKVGVFTLSFNDLTAPVAGLPIQVTRSYDSRDKRVGDFGIGWTLGLSNVRLQKNRNLGLSWSEDLQYSGFLPQFCLQPTSARIVTATFPDGKVYKFQAARQCQAVVAITNPTVTFQQLPGTAGTAGATLAPLDGGSALIDGGVPGVVNLIGFDGLPYNPTVFRLTTAQGFSYVIDQKLGVTSLTDPNGNTLTIGAGGVSSSTGTNVVFQRDAQGRITTITDPAGKAMTYAYNTGGDLASFTDRQGNTTSFAYAAGDFLTTITTPNGVVAINNSYDASGRLTSSLDALNATLSYNHDLTNRRETITDRLGNSTTYVYDSNGNILQTTDALGNVTTSTYDASDNKLTETNALGQTTRFAYDLLGNLVSQADPLGNTTRYTYNALQQPLTVTDPLGRATTNTYDSRGNLTSTKDPLGNTTTNVYNTRGLVTSTTDALGKITSFTYDAAGNLLTQTDALGTVTTSTYDANGNRLTQSVTRTLPGGGTQRLVSSFTYDNLNRLTRTTFPDGSSTQTIYNSLGQVSATLDALNRQTTFVYDNNGRLAQTTYPDATTDSTVYDAEGRRIKTTNRGIVTQFTYDKLGRLTQTTTADGATTVTNYDAIGQVISTTDARGNVTRYAYDGAGRRTQVSNALNQATVFTYDAAGNQTAVKDARGNTTTYTYDAANRRTKVTFPDGKFESTAYDALGRVVSRTDAAGKTTQYGYDALGRLTTVTDALNQVTSYTYDEVGNRITQTDANLHTTSYGYDQRGRRTRRALPLGQAESYVYDAAGSLVGRTDFNGKTTTYSYDSVNRLLSKTPDASFSAPQVRFTYTPTGKRATMVDPSGTTTYSYDLRDRLTSKATPQGTLTYSYDLASNLTALSTTGLTVNYNYGVLNRLATVSEANTGTTTYGFDAAGNLASFATPNGVAHAYTYDSRNRLTNLAVGTLASYAYTLDAAGHRTSVAELSGRTVNYTYDALYRLTSEAIACGAGIPACVSGSVSYTYDPVGNRKQTTSTIAQIPAGLFNYDANDRLSTDTYDANGNTIASAGVNNVYDFENHLISHGAVAMVYDGDGNRVAKTASGVTTRYLVDDLNPTGFAQVTVESIANSAGEQRHYVYGLERLSQRRVFTLSGTPAETRFYGYDGHGSVRLLTDAAGAVTDTYDYDAFGNLLSSTGLTPNEFRFAGEQFDFDLALYYNRARYLNTSTGRFWTMDNVEGSDNDPLTLHKYLYSSNDPVNRVDPSGNDDLVELSFATSIAQTIKGLAILSLKAAGFGAVFGAADALLQGKSGDDTLEEALEGGLLGAAFGPLSKIKFVAPVIIAIDTVGGIAGTVDAIEQRNFALAAFRGVATYVGFRTFVEQPAALGPEPGGRLGSASTRAQIAELAQSLRQRGWRITGGGGELPEEYLRPLRGGRKGGNFVDLTATKNGQTLRINTIDTLSDGVTPTAREARSAALTRAKISPSEQLILIPKNK